MLCAYRRRLSPGWELRRGERCHRNRRPTPLRRCMARRAMLQAGRRSYMDGPMTAQTQLFPCLKDNYGVLVHDPATGATAAIDAPEAAPVEAALAASGWTLTDILVTHHHGDHTGGIAELKRRYHCRVVAPRREADKIPAVDVEVGEGDRVKVGSLTARGDRNAGPHARPGQLLLSGRQAPVRRRHVVLDRLRPGDRRHGGD